MILSRYFVKLVLLLIFFVFLSGTGIFQSTAYSANPINIIKADIAVDKADRAYDNKNYTAAFAAYQQAANAGSAYGQYMLANMYLAGKGTKKDIEEYMYWIRQSSDRGDPSANYLMGMAYLKSNPTAAVKYFKKAARKEHGSAMHMLGLMYARGAGIKKDTKESVRWFRMAEAQGIPVKQKRLSKSSVDNSSTIREIQQRLTKLGYKPGPMDGLYGKRTRVAIQNFQRKMGMKPDGLANVKILRALRDSSH